MFCLVACGCTHRLLGPSCSDLKVEGMHSKLLKCVCAVLTILTSKIHNTVSIVDSNSENFWFPKHFLLTLQKPSHFIRKSFIQHNWITFIRWLKLNAVLKWNGIFMNFVSSGITFHKVASCRELTHFNLKRLIKL